MENDRHLLEQLIALDVHWVNGTNILGDKSGQVGGNLKKKADRNSSATFATAKPHQGHTALSSSEGTSVLHDTHLQTPTQSVRQSDRQTDTHTHTATVLCFPLYGNFQQIWKYISKYLNKSLLKPIHTCHRQYRQKLMVLYIQGAPQIEK